MKISNERKVAKKLAEDVQTFFGIIGDDYLPLDGDQTEELSVMFREELDELNGNK